MKEFKGYKEAKPYADQEKLPPGGYPIVIKAAKVESFDWGEILIIQFDISEGEYKDFYKENYVNQSMEDRKWLNSSATMRKTLSSSRLHSCFRKFRMIPSAKQH